MAAPLPGRWTAPEYETLAAIAETIVRGGARRRARLAIEAFEAAVDPSLVRQLRLTLRAFENPWVNVLLTGRAVRFRDLAPSTRERYLRAWATSRITQRRAAYQAFKRVLAFLAHADPGENGRNPLLDDIGYTDRPEPVTRQLTPIMPSRGTPDPRSGVVAFDADVVVVGSGAGGGVIAAICTGRSLRRRGRGRTVPQRSRAPGR